MYLVSSADNLGKSLSDDRYYYFFNSLAYKEGNFVKVISNIVVKLKIDAFLPMIKLQRE